MVLEFQSDPNTHGLDLQYMFGKSFLVAPIVTPVGRRQVYLPEGKWVDYWTKEAMAGGRWIEVEAGLETLPLWVRAAAIIPMGPEMAYVGEKPLDPLTLEVYYPAGETELVVHDEDEPDILVRMRRLADRLEVEVTGATRRVEIIVYGITAEAARRDGESLVIETCPPGQLVRFEGTGMDVVRFLLKNDR
jgi:alpha-D-xyloside xylohydrolase